MKQRRFDYKVKKGKQQNYRPVKSSKPSSSGSSNKGLLIIVAAFIFFLFLSWYILSKINTSTPISKESNIPAISHFILINDKGLQTRALHSVVVATLHRDSESIFLSYYPENLALSNENTLDQYYKNDGPLGLVNQFRSLIQGEHIYYTVIKRELYAQISPNLVSIKLWAENLNDLIVPQNIMKLTREDAQLYEIKGADLLTYLIFNKETRTLLDITSKENRMLYVIKEVIESRPSNVKRLVSAYHSYFPDHNFTVAIGREFQHYFNSTNKLIVYNLPLKYRNVNNHFELSLNKERYNLAIKEVDEIQKQKLDLTAKDYIRVARKIDPGVQSLINVKILDRSDRGNQNENPAYLAFYSKFFRVKSSFTQSESPIEESYIVNMRHQMELVNYARKALPFKQFYNSAHPKKDEIDLILVLGKKSPKFVQENE